MHAITLHSVSLGSAGAHAGGTPGDCAQTLFTWISVLQTLMHLHTFTLTHSPTESAIPYPPCLSVIHCGRAPLVPKGSRQVQASPDGAVIRLQESHMVGGED